MNSSDNRIITINGIEQRTIYRPLGEMEREDIHPIILQPYYYSKK